MIPTPSTFNFGKALKQTRKASGLSVVDATRKGEWSSTTSILGWEKGDRYPTVHNLYRLANVYGVKPEAILTLAVQIDTTEAIS